MKVNGLPVVRFEIEEHTGGPQGVGKGPDTMTCDSEFDAIKTMCRAKTRGNGATCVCRNRNGEGKLYIIGLVPGL